MESQIEEVKAKTDIVELIGHTVKLSRAGRNFKGLCPFHNEHTPSFMVSPERGTWRCFGCGEHGDAIAFLEKYENLSFVEALEQLANKAGIVLERQKRDVGQRDKQQRLYQLLELTANYYQYILHNHPSAEDARKYLLHRKISEETSNKFTLGYAPNSWQSLRQFVTKKGFSQAEMAAVGISSVGNSGREYDRFRDRLMFPIADSIGRVVGFSGRALSDDPNTPKYLNSPEGELFHKGKLLFGLNVAKDGIRQRDRLVLVEGNIDLLSSYQAGITEVVAPLGTALTPDQVLIIKKLTHNVILAYDQDKAGQEAAWRSLPLLQQQQLDVKVLQLPYGKDPDECIQQQPAKWPVVVDSAKEVFIYILDRVSSKYDITTAKGKKIATEEIIPFLSATTDPVSLGFLVHQAADVVGIEENLLHQQVTKHKNAPVAPTSQHSQPIPEPEVQSVPEPMRPKTHLEILCTYFLSSIVNTPPADLPVKSLKRPLQEIDSQAMPHDYQAITRALQNQVKTEGAIDLNKLAAELSEVDRAAFDLLILSASTSLSQVESPVNRLGLTDAGTIPAVETIDGLADRLLHTAIQINSLYLKEQLSQIMRQIKRASVLEQAEQQSLKKEFTQISEKLQLYRQKTQQ